MNPVRVLLCILLLLPAFVKFAAGQVNFFKEDPNTVVIKRTVDSLNELAFKVKKYDLNNALTYIETAKNIAAKNNYKKGLAVSALYEGGIFQQNGYANRALSLYYQAHQISKSINDTLNMARANQQIAMSHSSMGLQADAEKRLLETLVIYKMLNQREEIINVKNSLGVIKLGYRNFVAADENFREALAQSLTLGYPYGEKKAYFNLGLLFEALEKYDSSNFYLKKSFRLDSLASDWYGMSLTMIELAKVAYERNNITKTIEYAERADTMAINIQAHALRIEAMQPLLRVYGLQGRQTKLNETLQRIVRNQKDLLQMENRYVANFANAIREQQEKNFQAEKAAIDAERAARNQLILLIFIGSILLVVSLLLIPTFRNYRKTKKLTRELAEKNTLIQEHSESLDNLNKAISAQNKKLEEENKMKDKLLFTISHDLRHPIVNIKSILDLISLNLVSPEESQKLFRQLGSQYIKSLSLLDNLLYWIRGQMDDITLEHVKVNIYHLASLLLEEQRQLLAAKKIRVFNDIDKVAECTAEPEMLKVILRNLLNNAIKFTGESGSVHLSCMQDKTYSYISIKDTGTGLSKETLEKLRLKQYHSLNGTANETGSGLGLLLTKDLIERHKGELLIESQPGTGSTFTVKIPN
ncbi:sensor histidine kinase [Foetidibacter luteolus]|uniref:sensor histidine kinase n=1 Tax=Foetidibacter luteolus TaxID=2608880 RepID=UPI00129A4B77|nr:HAMP domain-containing sensor histidine kinase [Foetidibacter luteolus]